MLLFKPFSRLAHSVASAVPGVGLGLYITRRLVEAMGGSVTLCSGKGKGTSVTCTFPLALPHDERTSNGPLKFSETKEKVVSPC